MSSKPTPRNPWRRHGAHALQKLLVREPRRLDGRSSLAVTMRQIRDAIASDLGGDLSEAQRSWGTGRRNPKLRSLVAAGTGTRG